MSYHGLGQVLPGGYPTPIQQAPDPVSQPTSSIATMSMIQFNPMLPSGEAAAGDQAMMLEMQARAGDLTAFQPAMIQSGVPMTQDTNMIPVQPIPGGGSAPKPAPVTEEQLYNLLVKYYLALRAGKSPSELVDWPSHAKELGWSYLIGEAQMVVANQPKSSYPPLPSGESSTGQPADPIMEQGPPMTAPQTPHPVTGQFAPTGQITTYVDETGLHPAQPGAPVPSAPPPPPTNYDPAMGPITNQAPPSQGPITKFAPSQDQIYEGTALAARKKCANSGGAWYEGGADCLVDEYGQLYNCVPPTAATRKKYTCVPKGTPGASGITNQAPPSQGPITESAPSQDQIHEGTAPVGPIAPGVSVTKPSGYVAAPAAVPQAGLIPAKSNIVPIAIAAGAALLLSRLL